MHECDNIMLRRRKRLWREINTGTETKEDKKLRREKVQIMLMEKIKRMRSKLKYEG